MRIIWLHPAMKRYQEWKKYHTDIELWFAGIFVFTLTLDYNISLQTFPYGAILFILWISHDFAHIINFS